jgi:signal transduction histidine kinase
MTALVDAAVQPTAARSAERTIAAVAALSRAGALVILAASLTDQAWHTTRGVRVGSLAGLVLLESLAVIALALLTRRVARWWAALDVIWVAGLLALSAVPAVLPGRPGESPLYNFTVLAVLVFGLPDWPFLATVAATVALAAANLAGALRPGSTYPLWNAVLDCATYLGAGLVAWVLARLLRTSARSVDRHRWKAVVRAGALARERERVRLRHDLGTQLLSTVDELAGSAQITDPSVQAQIEREAAWLREAVRSGLTEPDRELLPALRDLVTEKGGCGMDIAAHLPASEPPLSIAVIGALVAATREALTNVAKHAGTDRATVTVRPADGGLVVEIADDGTGYDPAVTPGRIGWRRSIRGRIEQVGGHVEVESAPGAGTRVRLWVPEEPR